MNDALMPMFASGSRTGYAYQRLSSERSVRPDDKEVAHMFDIFRTVGCKAEEQGGRTICSQGNFSVCISLSFTARARFCRSSDFIGLVVSSGSMTARLTAF